MDPPPDYKDVVIQVKSIPSAPSYVSVFQQATSRSNSLFDVLEGKETKEAEKKQQTTNDEDKIAKISYFTSSHDLRRSPRECSIRSITNQDVRPSDEIHNNEKVSSPKQKFTKRNKNSHNLEGQKAFANRVAVHNYPERFPNEEDECSTAFGKTVSRTPSQAVSIPEKAFAETPYQFHSEKVLNHAQLGRYFYKLPSQHEERSVAIDKEEELQPGTRIVTVEPLSTANTVDNAKVQNEFPGLSVSPYGPNYIDREKRRKESYVYDKKRDSGVHAESERIHEKRTYCFVNMCFCASCRCALCSTSCRCTWLHCLPCLAYSTLCCPFWVVCLFCSFFNPCWKEILHVTSSFLKHLASNCKSEPGNNCSFTCLADDAEETLWDVRNWGCGFEEAQEL